MVKRSKLGASASAAGDGKTKKIKKKSKPQPGAIAMKAKAFKADNPFETIWSRRKFDILGKKRKGEERRVGLARSRAIDKRKKTLLKEYEQSGKASVFLDKRIGEDNEEIGEFQKALLRSQCEYKLKLNRKSKYNLSDGEEDDLGLGGGSFEGMDDFKDEMLPDDDDEFEPTERDPHFLKQLHTHNNWNSADTDVAEGEENRHKSKKEVMEEIIFKSKYFKAQKAKEKEENEQFMEELDKNFTSLVQSEALLSLTDPGKMKALKALANKNIPGGSSASSGPSTTQNVGTFMQQEKPDSYDKLVKEMSLDMRARPSDRTKTPEEIAQEERERLEELEEERQKRMLASDDQSDEDGEDVDRPSSQQFRSISGDGLGDSFSLEEEPRNKRGWVDEILARKDEEYSEGDDEDSSEESDSAEIDGDEEGSDEDEIGHEKTSNLKDWEQSDDELDADLEDEEDEEDEHEDDDEDESDGGKKQMEPNSKKAKIRDVDETREKIIDSSDGAKLKVKQVLDREKSLPYLIEAPKSLEELNKLFEGHSNSEIVLLISRVQASNAIALAAENRKKIQVFYGVLLQYFAVSANMKPLNFELLNVLVKPLVEMSMEIPYFAAICARQRILRTRTQFCEAIKSSEVSSWPSLKTLFLLRLWSMIFPCSDFRHAVMTPAILLMCEYLMRCPILSGRDIAIGSFLCSMVLSVTKQSRKFCPEAIMFIQSLLFSAIDRNVESNNASQFYHLMEVRAHGPLLCVNGAVNEITLNFFKLMDMPEDSAFFNSDNFRASILASVLETLRGFLSMYEQLSSFPELFLPISALLLEVAENEKLPEELRNKLKDLAEIIKKKGDEHQSMRKPLQMQKQKPVPIKLVNPKFEENFVKGRDYDPDKGRSEMRKLKKLVKREAKGAVRELRKDNYFLSVVKEKDRQLLEQEKSEKYGKARAFLQEQEHAFKSGQLGKGKGKKRR